MNKSNIINHRLTLEKNVEIMFIVKDEQVLYFNKYADVLFQKDKDGDLKLDGRVVKIVYKGLFSKIEVFVAFDDTESYTMFTAGLGRDERLHYVASEIITFLSKNRYDKRLNIKIRPFFKCYSAYKLYKRNDRYYMVNNGRNDAYIISAVSYKNSSNVDSMINEFFNSKENNTDNTQNNYLNSEEDNLKENAMSFLYSMKTFNDYLDNEEDNQKKDTMSLLCSMQTLVVMKQYFEQYGSEKVFLAYALIIDETFCKNNMSIKLKQMLQFLREEADAAYYSELQEIKNLGSEIFSDKSFYLGAMDEKNVAYPIDNDGRPQQALLSLLMPILTVDRTVSAEYRAQIVKHIAQLFNFYSEITNSYNAKTHKECIELSYKYYPDIANKLNEGYELINIMHQNLDSFYHKIVNTEWHK